MTHGNISIEDIAIDNNFHQKSIKIFGTGLSISKDGVINLVYIFNQSLTMFIYGNE